MSKMARTAMVVAGAMLVTSVAQAAPPLQGFSLKAQTPRFSFYVRGNHKVDARKAEQFLSRVETLLGAQVGGRTEYYRYGTPEELAAGTGQYAAGVTFAHNREIHSTQEFHPHEIVHLVAGQLGDPGAFFHEGLAVTVGNEGKWNGKDVDAVAKPHAKATIATLVAGFDRMDPQVSYAVAGSFMGHLVRTHGMDKVSEFFRTCGSAKGAWAPTFAKVFGQSADQAGAAWVASL